MKLQLPDNSSKIESQIAAWLGEYMPMIEELHEATLAIGNKISVGRRRDTLGYMAKRGNVTVKAYQWHDTWDTRKNCPIYEYSIVVDAKDIVVARVRWNSKGLVPVYQLFVRPGDWMTTAQEIITKGKYATSEKEEINNNNLASNYKFILNPDIDL